MSLPPSATIFTVSQLNSTVRQLLEGEMGQIWLNAEISNFSQPSSGHWYFTLKDHRTQVRCAMFRNTNRQIDFRPQNGQQVLVRATITLYEPRGDYQLIAESMRPAGDGLLQQYVEALKQRLSVEGLFSQHLKQPLPNPARQPGIITSATGAALHDILHILHRRDPGLPIVIYPVPVQGTDAPERIAAMIALANLRNECDVLIVGRGGGSLEDLWSFNDERVARAIFASHIPVVSAVGHETDVTIADFVADLRAPTPSAAAELVSRNQPEMLRRLQAQQQQLAMTWDYYLAKKQRVCTRLEHRLQQHHPQLRLAHQQTALLKRRRQLDDAIQSHVRRASRLREQIEQRLMGHQLLPVLHRTGSAIKQWQFRLQQTMQNQLAQRKQHFSRVAAQLESSSPLATLARGFSITTRGDNAVKTIHQLQPGDMLKTQLKDGWAESQITQITPMRKSRKRVIKKAEK
ncbi:exodeoxyribonuclease VII large subunit [Enterobacteriaceae bacterium LUAb1]